MDTIDPTIKNLVSAIGRAETGNPSPEAYTKKGASGEFGRYQFMPETYKAYAKKYIGDENAEPTMENQNKIAYSFVKEKKDAGYNPAQIASMWNAGEGRPNAYKEGHSGVNSKGVKYDTGEYARRVSQFYNEMKGSTPSQPQTVEQQRTTAEMQGEPVSVNEEKVEPTGAGKIIRGILRTPARLGVNLNQAFQVAQGETPTNTQSKYLGELKPIGEGLDVRKSPLQKDNLKAIAESAGAGLDLGSTIAGGGGTTQIVKQGAKALVKQAAKQGAKAGAISGVAGGLGEGLREGKSATEVVGQGVLGGVAGAAGGGILGGIGGLLGKGAEKAGIKAISQSRVSQTTPQEVLDMVNPKLSSKGLKTALKQGRGEKGGLLGDISVKPDAKTIKAAESVTGIIDPNKTLVENINITKNALSQEAEALKNAIATQDHPYVFKELQSRLRNIQKPISVKSNATWSKQFDLVRQAAMDIAKKRGGKVSSLLDARKEFDDLIEREIPNLYDRAETPMKNAVKEIRREINNFISENLPQGAGFKESLSRQSSMFDAIDGMVSKAVSEIGTNSIQRTAGEYPVISGLLKKGVDASAAGGIFKAIGL